MYACGVEEGGKLFLALLFSGRFSLTRLLQKLPRKQLTLTDNKTQYFSKLLKYINPLNIHEFVNLLANERKESGVNWRSILRSFYFLVYLSISFSDFFTVVVVIVKEIKNKRLL